MTPPSTAHGAAGPLAGVVVIDLTHIYNGPYATFLMAMAGARVIKVEPPGGEHLRVRADLGGAALPFAMLNNNKDCVTLNLKTPEGRALLMEMTARADVLAENFAPGVAERLGIGAEVLQAANPRLIYASSSGYGRSGPYREYPAMDVTVQAMSGIMSATGFPDQPPVKAGAALCDFSAGMHLFGGVMMALYEREKTGKGRVVEVSMQESVYPTLASNLSLAHATGKPPPRTGNRHGGLAESPYNVYPASDGYVAIIGNTNDHFRALSSAMGQPALARDPRFSSLKARVENIDLVDRLVGAWTTTRGRDAVCEILQTHRVPHAPVRDLIEVMHDPNMHARGSLQWIDHPQFGRMVVQNSPIRFDGIAPMPLDPSHALGADNVRVFGGWLGKSDKDLERLAAQGAI